MRKKKEDEVNKDGMNPPNDQKSNSNRFEHKKGWSIEGLKQCNTLFDRVTDDRKNHSQWFKSFVEFMKNDDKKEATEKPAARKREIPVMRSNLFNKKPCLSLSAASCSQPENGMVDSSSEDSSTSSEAESSPLKRI